MSLRKLSESQWNLLMAHYGEPETREQWGGTVPNSFEAASANAARAAARTGCFAVDDAAGGWRARRLTVTLFFAGRPRPLGRGGTAFLRLILLCE